MRNAGADANVFAPSFLLQKINLQNNVRYGKTLNIYIYIYR